MADIAARGAVFLDRDGTINANVYNPATNAWESPHQPEDFALVPGALPAMKALQERGFLLFLVTNQPSYAKAKTPLHMIEAVQARLTQELHDAGITFRAQYVCLHHPEGTIAGFSGPCACRKPSPYFLNRAARDFGLDLARSWMVGDRGSDVECGERAGVRTIRVAPHPQPAAPGIRAGLAAADLSEAAAIILSQG